MVDSSVYRHDSRGARQLLVMEKNWGRKRVRSAADKESDVHNVVILHDRKKSCSNGENSFPQDGPIQDVIGESLSHFKMDSSPKTYDIIIVGGELQSNRCNMHHEMLIITYSSWPGRRHARVPPSP